MCPHNRSANMYYNMEDFRFELWAAPSIKPWNNPGCDHISLIAAVSHTPSSASEAVRSLVSDY